MTARTAVALAALVTVTAVTEIITGAGLTARIVTVLVLAGITGGGWVLRLIGGSKGQHAAPRGFTADDERIALPCERETIPRAVTEHAPPWEDQPAPVIEHEDRGDPYRPEPPPRIIEPAAVTSGPPERDVPATWVMTAYRTPDGRITSLQVITGDETAPAWYGSAACTDAKIRTGMGVPLPPWVAAELGHDSADDALESMWNRAQALELRERLADGRP